MFNENFQEVISVLTLLCSLITLIVSIANMYINRKKLRKLYITWSFLTDNEGKIALYVTVENLGNVAIILDSIGSKLLKNGKVTDLRVQQYLVNKDIFPLKINAGESSRIDFEYNCTQEEIPYMKETLAYKLMNNCKPVVTDTIGYQYESEHNWK